MIVCYAVNITHENLAEELVKQGYLVAVTGLQKLDFNYRYGITFRDFNLRDKLVVNGLDIGTQHISYMYHAKKSELTRVLVSKLPMGISGDDICAALNNYGDILSVQQVTRVMFGQKLDTGDRVVKFKKIHKDIPSYVTVRGWKAYIMYKGQLKTSRFCGKVGHFAKDCPSKRKSDERPRENQDKPEEKEKADEPTVNMEVTESSVIPTHEDLVKDLLDNLAEPEPDSVQVPAKVAENLDSDITSKVFTNESVSNPTSEVKPLGAKDSMKGDPGVAKRGKKKRKKNLNRAVLDQLEDTTAVKDSLVQDTVPTGMNYFGPLNWSVSFGVEKQCYVYVFCDTTAASDYLIEDHVRVVHKREYGDYMTRLHKPQYPCTICRYIASSEFMLSIDGSERHGIWG